jgi:alkanesulfonate monooxygenase SsuD/methylene tetrahydromethanopterin reductase-like flavin-dependent oxidoreductase (luciferase family)
VRAIDPGQISFGYLVPTRDAIVTGDPAAGPLLDLGERAERLGFDALWVGDGPLARPRHDALLMLSALAARTERVRLGTAVLLGALRPALLLAQAVATLDSISGGRVVLGLGAGFPFPETERQFEAVGVPFAGRIGRLTETVQALRALWRCAGSPIDFEGRHIALHEVALQPPPHRLGGPPIWLAGSGEAAELRVGRIADGWLPYPPTPELYAESWERVRASAAEAARTEPPVPGLYATVCIDDSSAQAQERLRHSIERYYEQPLELIAAIQALHAGTAESIAEWLAAYVRAGARHVVLRIADEQPERGLEAAAAAIQMVREA